MLEKPAITQAPIHDLLAKRWSSRAFDKNKMLSRQDITSLLEAARWSPSCYGDEPWRFVVCDKATQPEAWQNGFDCLAEMNQSWVKNAPLLIVVAAMKQFKHNGEDNPWAMYDVGAACENLCLQAVALGLTTHQMAGFDPQKLKQTFKLPETVQATTVIAVGYQTEMDVIEIDELKQRELAERQRMSLDQLCFAGEWGQGFSA
ncbi:MAG: nitroreductase family protein [Thiotrichaceae bacterium]|nr:nitroreductase family protein [Thiotrichaceae bacterium]